MPFSSGVFSRVYNWVTDKNNSVNITASRMDTEMNGMATGLSTCILKDGTQTVTANIPFAGFKLTGVGAGTAATDVANVSQIQNQTANWIASGGTADVITATYSPAVTALSDGMLLSFRATAANATTTPTFSPNGLTAHTITKNGGSVLVAGDIAANLGEYFLRYNLANTRWELLNPAIVAVTVFTGVTINNSIIGGTTAAAGSFTSLNGGQLAGFRNAIINGSCRIWQRGTSFTPLASTNTYTADRWCALRNTNANYTVTRQTSGLAGSFYCLRVQRTNATSDTNGINLVYNVETLDSYRFASKKVTISFKAKCGANYSAASSALSITVSTGTGTDQNLTGGYTGQSNVIGSTATLTTSFQTFSYTSASACASSITQIGIQIVFTPVGTAGAADSFDITDIQLEEDVNATPFERLSFGQDTALCERYYEKSFIYGTAPAQSAGTTGAITVLLPTGATGTFGQSIQMVSKRIAPLITTYNPSASNANWRDTTNGADRTVTVGVIGENSFSISGASGAAAATNAIHWQANAEIP